PTVKSQKAAKKDAAKRRKQAKKDGLSKAEIAAIRDPEDDQPIWKMMLWATVSGVILQGLRVAAKRGAQTGTERLVTRRPRPNRGRPARSCSRAHEGRPAERRGGPTRAGTASQNSWTSTPSSSVSGESPVTRKPTRRTSETAWSPIRS